MNEVASRKPPAPPLTMALQLLGIIALVMGTQRAIADAGCTELGCVGFAYGIFAAVWGVVALLSGLRGRRGLIFLLIAIVSPLLVLWLFFPLSLLFLLIVGVAASASKERLAPYYRWPGVTA